MKLSHFKDQFGRPINWFGRPYGGKFVKESKMSRFIVFAPRSLASGSVDVPKGPVQAQAPHLTYPSPFALPVEPKREGMPRLLIEDNQ